MKYFPKMGIAVWCCITLLAAVGAAGSQNAGPGVVVLPFQVLSDSGEMPADLGDQIAEKISEALAFGGARLIAVDLSDQAKTGDLPVTVRRALGKTWQADYLISGMLVRMQDALHLEIELLQTDADVSPVVFSETAGSMAELSGAVSKLSDRVISRLFPAERIVRIDISGNRRVDAPVIERAISTRPGDRFVPAQLTADLKAIYKLGLFSDVRVEATDAETGKEVSFVVKEKPVIRQINITGNDAIDTDKIKEVLSVKAGGVRNDVTLLSDMERIRSLYREKNYHHTRVNYRFLSVKEGQEDLEVVISEGERLKVEAIIFEGNTVYTAKELSKFMQTKKRGFFSFLTGSGELKPEVLEQDMDRIGGQYYREGYINARVAKPEVDYTDAGIRIKVKIEEGPRFKVGNVSVEGDLIEPEAVLLEGLNITDQVFCNREILHHDVIHLSDLYSDQGYANVDVFPRLIRRPEEGVADVVFMITKGNQVYFDQILITGNVKTRDKVIRRQLSVYEQERYSGQKLKRGIRNLNYLDYFESVNVDTVPGEDPDTLNLIVEVKEKSTGEFSFGGGYSSQDNAFLSTSIAQRNLFGRGQTLNLKAEVAGSNNKYTFSFTEPWLFDIPLSAGFDVYDWDREYAYYDKDTLGGGFRIGYPVFDFTRATFAFAHDMSNFTHVKTGRTTQKPGREVLSRVSGSLRYDSRDRQINPTRGFEHRGVLEYAGTFLGGDIEYTKYRLESAWFRPVWGPVVGMIHGEAGYIDIRSDDTVDYERFYLGGMNSIRGYKYRDIHVEDQDGYTVGGNKYWQVNAELTWPIVAEMGLMGVVFVDTGNVYYDGDAVDPGIFRSSVGGGFRWFSPMGPIRFEYGYILNPAPEGREGGRWDFTMGAAF
ncbi:MAG: outer membrane protein assembly factor BamA [Deltaproteobacteria bacterium]|nr:MAG: outer membrane protein assembly factor BamA [Deltaproteobacteria bacterium]